MPRRVDLLLGRHPLFICKVLADPPCPCTDWVLARPEPQVRDVADAPSMGLQVGRTRDKVQMARAHADLTLLT